MNERTQMIRLTTDKCHTRTSHIAHAHAQTRHSVECWHITRKNSNSDSALASQHFSITVNDRKFHVLMKKDAFNFSLTRSLCCACAFAVYLFWQNQTIKTKCDTTFFSALFCWVLCLTILESALFKCVDTESERERQREEERVDENKQLRHDFEGDV